MESVDQLPAPPYYAVIFTSWRTAGDPEGYERALARMLELARLQPGFLGVESARGADGRGITVSYWTDRESIDRWRRHSEHLEVQHRGRGEWYASYSLQICQVERHSVFPG